MVECATYIRSWSGIMATWTGPLQLIMQVRAPWTEPGVFRGIARRENTSRKSPIPISGPAPIGFPMRLTPHVPFTAWQPTTDGRCLPTNGADLAARCRYNSAYIARIFRGLRILVLFYQRSARG